jgi:uncharacterized protein YdeI (BOF family)
MMICAGLLFGISNYASAQYSGPGGSSSKDSLKSALGIKSSKKEKMTVKELKRDPIYDEEIVLRGKMTNKLDDDDYRFEVSTGRMTIIIPS